jgi:hypothetical protein
MTQCVDVGDRLNLPAGIVPATHKKPARPARPAVVGGGGAGRGGEGAYRAPRGDEGYRRKETTAEEGFRFVVTVKMVLSMAYIVFVDPDSLEWDVEVELLLIRRIREQACVFASCSWLFACNKTFPYKDSTQSSSLSPRRRFYIISTISAFQRSISALK